MKARLFFGVVVAMSAGLMVHSSIGAGEKKKEQKKEQKKDAAPEMVMPKPGPEHKLLAKIVGKWDCKVKAWMGPGEPTESTATVTRVSLMGGLYVKEDAVGAFGPAKFTGMGIFGYDVNKKKFVMAWIDNFGTGISNTTGDYNDAAKTLTFTGEEDNPMMGGKMKVRDVFIMKSDDLHVMEMYRTPEKGKEFKIMEITMNRAAGKKK